MARNLVKEAEKSEEIEREEAELKALKSTATTPGEEKKEVIIMTTENVMLNNLQIIASKQEEILSKLIEGFKKVGVNFE